MEEKIPAQQEPTEKILFPSRYFNVIEKDGFIGIRPHSLSVVVFPYITGSSGLPEDVVLIKEPHPLRKGGSQIALVSGTAEGEDPDLLTTAQRELLEETGYEVTDPNRWTYLGVLTNSKIVEQEQPAFAVDVTGIKIQEPTGDGSEAEEKMEVIVMPIKKALDLPDMYISALFIRVFKYVFGVDFNK